MSANIERIINLAAFLAASSKPVEVEEIRNTIPNYRDLKYSTFRRMFERDKKDLRAIGMELELKDTGSDAWEITQGYVISDKSYRVVEPDLTHEERAALAMAVHVVSSGAWPDAARGLVKLGGGHVAGSGLPVGADLRFDRASGNVLYQAVSEARPISFSYRGQERTLHPYGIRYKAGRWYFAGKEPGVAGVRTFRLDRAGQVRIAGEPGAFTRPPDFDARDILSSLPWEEPHQRTATVACHPSLASWVRYQTRQEEGNDRVVNGEVIMEIPYARMENLLNMVLMLDNKAVILDPPEARQALIRRLEDAL